ncbi:malate synthase A [Streptomyces sp. NPDC004539]|uniref:malate synthase n=1 Tax=Streptomyces sp. NPDC004539 TaxID=3154280 RepID=UPI0033A09D95
MSITALTHAVRVLAAPGHRHDEILTPAALDFVGRLVAAFGERRRALMKERRRQALRLAAGSPLDFPMVTRSARADPGWRVAPPAPGLTDRRVEITGPPDRRTTAEALGSGACVWTADFEDATAPLWDNVVGGQLNLLDAVEQRSVTVVVQPRGWHLDEEHLECGGGPVPAALVDFGLYFFHCARRRTDAGQGPYFCLPKLENRYEARLWNDIFLFAQDLLGIPRGTVRATVVIETITAAFEMEEILHELREHSSGLALGYWNHLTSLVKTFGHRTDFLLPDRSDITPSAPFLLACADLLVDTCHRRGAHAIGATTDQFPGAVTEVRLGKEREATAGFDGSRVRHPSLVPVCREVFDASPGDRHRDAVEVTPADLLSVRRVSRPPTSDGVRANVRAALRYFTVWLHGQGTVTADGIVEDAAVAEISRVQIWQWLRHRLVDRETVERIVDDEIAALGAGSDVRGLFERTTMTGELPLFFTPDAYSRHLVRGTEAGA